MADIKFMDISENDNPATTDSVLIANQQDGVKRTSLENIGNMFAGHSLLHTESVTVQLTDGKKQSYNIKAPDIAGYTFLAWISCSSQGRAFSTYIDQPTSQSASIWIDTVIFTDSAFQTYVNNAFMLATALYVKNNVA